MTRRLLYAALAVVVASGVLSAVAAIIWPEHWPSWVSRASPAGYLAGVLLVVAGLLAWLRDDRP